MAKSIDPDQMLSHRISEQGRQIARVLFRVKL